MEVINTKKAPGAIGPYVQAIKLDNGMLYASGALGLNPETMKLTEGIKNQTKQALSNIDAILKEAGYTKDDVVKTLILLSDIKNFGEMNEIYGEYFSNNLPARSAFQVGALPMSALVEIEIVAYKK